MLPDHHRPILARCLLYGSPVVAAVLMFSARQFVLLSGIIHWWRLDGALYFVNALLAAFGSAAGAILLPNCLAIRIPHAFAASLVSVVLYALLYSVMVWINTHYSILDRL